MTDPNPVERALLTESRAGAFLDRSRSWLRMKRQEDLARIKRGLPPVGPPWITISKSVFYRPGDLIGWIEEQAVSRGRVNFDKSES